MQGPADPQRGTGTGPAAAQCRPENRCTGDKGARGAGRGSCESGTFENIVLYPRSLWHRCFVNQQAKDVTSHQEHGDGLQHKNARQSERQTRRARAREHIAGRAPGSTSQAAHASAGEGGGWDATHGPSGHPPEAPEERARQSPGQP